MILDKILDLWDWWSTEIYRMLPHRPSRIDHPVIQISRTGTVVQWPGASQAESVAFDDLAKALERTQACTLLFAEDRYIRRQIADSALPYSRAKEIAEADLIAQTPFRSEEVYCVPATGSDGSPCAYAIIKRTFVDPYLSSLAAAKIKIKVISLGKADGIVARIPERAVREILPKAARILPRSYILTTALSILAVTTALTVSHAFFRYDRALAALDTDIALKRQKAVSARAALNERAKKASALDAARRRKEEAIPVIAVWEEISRRFPDGAWLTDLSLDRGTLKVSGFAQSAAGLIGPLEGSLLFSEPSFTSPIVRVPGQNGEHFEMRLKVGQE
ncbi:PilN domain-containing protein [Rhizobium leguminosarum]|uniref:PilN domain-containing protein n=1 Tax=Rhizobium leguminosarum TaxID=384 RepID=UPI001C94232A|nr:PilN domain-containing protein [Rhizobium leguminosarum]MBY5531535.1 PilN domain-containing protein [Rhizobium leguminosarum]